MNAQQNVKRKGRSRAEHRIMSKKLHLSKKEYAHFVQNICLKLQTIPLPRQRMENTLYVAFDKSESNEKKRCREEEKFCKNNKAEKLKEDDWDFFLRPVSGKREQTLAGVYRRNH